MVNKGVIGMIQIVKANIFTTGAKYICHQTNCISIGAAGLAKNIFNNYPYSDCYSNRKLKSIPGTIQVCGDGLKQRYIINMFGQYYPGIATSDINDTIEARKKYFFNCLMEIAKINDLQSIAFPEKVGCGLAGGDWEWYFNKLQKFSEYVKHKAVVLIYKLED
jgi:O-acetyl-ADP-ribose deacetylase (regulator of RNase III)